MCGSVLCSSLEGEKQGVLSLSNQLCVQTLGLPTPQHPGRRKSWAVSHGHPHPPATCAGMQSKEPAQESHLPCPWSSRQASPTSMPPAAC